MRSATLRLQVYGDSYDELIEATETQISNFLDIEVSDIQRYANYELIISDNSNMGSDASYEADVIVRIKDDRK